MADDPVEIGVVGVVGVEAGDDLFDAVRVEFGQPGEFGDRYAELVGPVERGVARIRPSICGSVIGLMRLVASAMSSSTMAMSSSRFVVSWFRQ